MRVQELELENIMIENCSQISVIKKANESLLLEENRMWQKQLWNDKQNEVHGNKLRLYRLIKSEVTWQPETYLMSKRTRAERRTLAQLRSGALCLAIETGRYTRPKTPVENRLCQFCDKQCVENEIHFIIVCEFYSDLRYQVLQAAATKNPQFTNYSDTIKFQFLQMEFQQDLVKLTQKMFYRRRAAQK